MKSFFTLLFFVFSVSLIGQIHQLVEKYDLPKKVKETSGLIYWDGHLVTHNDSGDDPILYELDTISGTVIREVTIRNADHQDWEDITQDETYIYIADIGNNDGDRKDLRIYRITKTDFLQSEEVDASVISYDYEDQIDFTENHHYTNFDAEGLTIYGDSLMIFTKNWVDLETNVYYVPTIPGSYTAIKVSNYDVQGLVTGVTYNPDDKSYFICGYQGGLSPFLIRLGPSDDNDIFGGVINKFDITPDIGAGSQTEGIAYIGGGNYFLSREKSKTKINGSTIKFFQKLYRFQYSESVNASEEIKSLLDWNIYPNPFNSFLDIDVLNGDVSKVEILDLDGQVIFNFQLDNTNKIDLSYLEVGVYIILLHSAKGSVSQKIIKL